MATKGLAAPCVVVCVLINDNVIFGQLMDESTTEGQLRNTAAALAVLAKA